MQLVIVEKGQYRAAFAGWDQAQAEVRAQLHGWSPDDIIAGSLIHLASSFDGKDAQLFAMANGLVLPRPVYDLAPT